MSRGGILFSEVGDMEGDLDFLCLDVVLLFLSECGDLKGDLEVLSGLVVSKFGI